MSTPENTTIAEVSDSTIVFFCKDCKAVVNAQRISPNKYAYKCPECNSIKVAFGTMRSIKEFYLRK